MPSPLDHVRVDLVGSLLRPASLKQAFASHQTGLATDAELRAHEDHAVRRVVAEQEARGLPLVTDGEFRRLNFQDSFAASVEGFELSRNSFLRQTDPGADKALTEEPLPPSAMRHAVVRPLRVIDNLPRREYEFASRATRVPVKVSLIGPERMLYRFDEQASRGVYSTRESFLSDLVSVERELVEGLVQAGCRYVHVDEPGYTGYVDPPTLDWMRARGEDPMTVMQTAIQADNAIIQGFPDVTFGVHLCRGNARSMWHRQGSYDAIAEQLFNGLAHQRLLLEYDSDRAGGFEPLRFVPADKTIVLGLISTKVPELETVDGLRQRIDEAARYLPLEQLAISPQCGFASDIAGNLLSEDDQWRKLEIMLETARRVWG